MNDQERAKAHYQALAAEAAAIPQAGDVLATLRRMRNAKHSFKEADEAIATVSALIDATTSLLASASKNMTHRNAKEREAYKALRAILGRDGGAA